MNKLLDEYGILYKLTACKHESLHSKKIWSKTLKDMEKIVGTPLWLKELFKESLIIFQ